MNRDSLHKQSGTHHTDIMTFVVRYEALIAIG